MDRVRQINPDLSWGRIAGCFLAEIFNDLGQGFS
jgi:hypothetical protein